MSNRVVVVTGAAGKLGSVLCQSLAQSNDVVAAYHTRKPEFPSQLSWPATGNPDEKTKRPWCVQVDLNNLEDVRRLVEVCLARHSRIDVVVNAAADIRYRGRVTNLYYDRDSASDQIALNCIAPCALISVIFHECWKHERHLNTLFNRNVINISSFSSMYVQTTSSQAYYGASKAALNILTLHLAAELAPYGVRANVLCPARFPDNIAIQKVVAAITELASGNQTGEVVELTSR
jgi:NAD(P)-dependent dehydrogenase (short-subunit alcohol dehydrogenase family)